MLADKMAAKGLQFRARCGYAGDRGEELTLRPRDVLMDSGGVLAPPGTPQGEGQHPERRGWIPETEEQGGRFPNADVQCLGPVMMSPPPPSNQTLPQRPLPLAPWPARPPLHKDLDSAALCRTAHSSHTGGHTQNSDGGLPGAEPGSFDVQLLSEALIGCLRDVPVHRVPSSVRLALQAAVQQAADGDVQDLAGVLGGALEPPAVPVPSLLRHLGQVSHSSEADALDTPSRTSGPRLLHSPAPGSGAEPGSDSVGAGPDDVKAGPECVEAGPDSLGAGPEGAELLQRLLVERVWELQLIHPALPPKPPRRIAAPPPAIVHGNSGELSEAEWYWGEVSREEVNERLRHAPDGSFLVRDATSKVKGEYTLTLRKGGSNKLIKILHRGGRYGFSEPLTFLSVVELINHYRHRSLAHYNAQLDTRLLFAVSKNQQDQLVKEDSVQEVGEQLKLFNQQYQEKSHEYDALYELYTRTSRELQMKSTALEAFSETIKIFQEQWNTQDCPVQGPSEEETQRWLTQRGTRLKQFHQWLGVETEAEDLYSVMGEDEEGALPHRDELTWYVGSVKRAQAEEMLKGRSHGTFLVRDSQSLKGSFACSVVVNGEVKHCVICKTVTGFGFAEPYNLYGSLKELVLHYRHRSLGLHNHALNVTLSCPVFSQRSRNHDHEHNHEHNHEQSHNHDHKHSHEHDHKHSHEHDHNHEHNHEHKHSHEHDHNHEHNHEHDHNHSHEHSQNHSHNHKHSHEHNHNHEHDHNHDHEHGHSQNHERSHNHDHDHDHNHSHSHDHDHNHNHNHSQNHEHSHNHEHNHEHDHNHNHDHNHDHKHSHEHDHNHEHGHNHDHDHNHEHSQNHEHERNQDHNHEHGPTHYHNHDHDHALNVTLSCPVFSQHSHNHKQGHNHEHDHDHDHNHKHKHNQEDKHSDTNSP